MQRVFCKPAKHVTINNSDYKVSACLIGAAYLKSHPSKREFGNDSRVSEDALKWASKKLGSKYLADELTIGFDQDRGPSCQWTPYQFGFEASNEIFGIGEQQ